MNKIITEGGNKSVIKKPKINEIIGQKKFAEKLEKL